MKQPGSGMRGGGGNGQRNHRGDGGRGGGQSGGRDGPSRNGVSKGRGASTGVTAGGKRVFTKKPKTLPFGGRSKTAIMADKARGKALAEAAKIKREAKRAQFAGTAAGSASAVVDLNKADRESNAKKPPVTMQGYTSDSDAGDLPAALSNDGEADQNASEADNINGSDLGSDNEQPVDSDQEDIEMKPESPPAKPAKSKKGKKFATESSMLDIINSINSKEESRIESKLEKRAKVNQKIQSKEKKIQDKQKEKKKILEDKKKELLELSKAKKKANKIARTIQAAEPVQEKKRVSFA
ncbi:hypothetical protein HDV05_000257 [Chytridiales sp. JEL 0842]|nr:hypothetical protein HDV05_000257 [Chytridiales sp. JEL 0842]